jgi:eukaryotic-like serine/threonine-protein kinase
MLGRYELLMPIAKGGMGNVWAARLLGTRGFRKLVAIKTVLRTSENAQLEQMLFQEAVLASQVHHPNVAETFELGEHEGTLYLVMELVAGESLRFMLREAQAAGGIPLAVSVNLVGQICRGLAAAHDLRDEDGKRVGLIHRDISPPNVLVTDAGTVKIIDFGVATTAASAVLGSGEVKGKISYLAPEQLRGEPMDARVDVFATGIVLYLLTVGRHPFRCASESATIARILSSAPADSPSVFKEDYPSALEQVVLRALEKKRDTRIASVTELLEALENAYPSAFGPRADEMVTSYVQALTKDRLQERRASLRFAEEWAETSSSRHSISSVPAVAASAAPSAKAPRAAWFGVGGMLTGLAVAAVAGTLHLRISENVPRAAAGMTMQPSELSDTQSAQSPRGAATVAPQQALSPTTSATVDVPGAALPQLTDEKQLGAGLGGLARARKASTTKREERERDAPVESPEGETATEVTSEGLADVPAVPATLSAAVVPAAAHPVITASPPPLVGLAPPRPSPPSPAATGPRLLASKLGHRQLLTNPRAKAVRLPAALQRSGQTFSATVNICVGTSGEVTKVSILRSAGPALDPQIVELLSRWRYRPLTEGGRTSSFCYPMNYEVEPD